MFNDLYKDYIQPNFKVTNEYTDQQIERAIILHQGDSIPGFPSIDSFLYLIQPQLEKIREPALDTLHNVFIYLENLT
jgi:vacuolar protein sorting-associated protein 1